jgi:hypothetical protein
MQELSDLAHWQQPRRHKALMENTDLRISLADYRLPPKRNHKVQFASAFRSWRKHVLLGVS